MDLTSSRLRLASDEPMAQWITTSTIKVSAVTPRVDESREEGAAG
jgi:hypothetical protein